MSNKVLVLGIDGYIGWGLGMRLAKMGYAVTGIDNYMRRKLVGQLGSDSATPILEMPERLEAFKKIHGKQIHFFQGDLLDYDFLMDVFKQTKPDTIVHLAEQPSVSYSMINRRTTIQTQHNNVEGTLNLMYAMKEIVPEAHLVKLGSMGEYGAPNVEIPEGFIDIEYNGRHDTLPFPRQPYSIYHLSKVHDNESMRFGCRVWNLRVTTIMQGIVCGTRTQEMTDDSLLTRFDFDDIFGTVINRFCAEAVIGYPLTPYGLGTQKRGFVDLEDSIQGLSITIANPPAAGEFRVFNQVDEVCGIYELAMRVAGAAKKHGLSTEIRSTKNPRVENKDHHYTAIHDRLGQLGFKPSRTVNESIGIIMRDLMKFRDRVIAKSHHIAPKTAWQGAPPTDDAPNLLPANETSVLLSGQGGGPDTSEKGDSG